MKRIVASAVVLLSMIGSANAAEVIWRGSFLITGKSGTCNYDPINDTYNVRFLPRNVGTNGTAARFSLFAPFYAQAFRLPGSNFNATPKTVEYSSIWASVGSPPFPVTVAFTTQSPANPLQATDEFVNIRGAITNYDFMEGCNITFRMSLNLQN
jgi:hypothetical protein